ncbi:hypothetical protein KIL84_017402 [Mauremys mutica]|uniref:Uncharacterized protein n=1 Tax=Mauremys mutica TaxID=74926 RepID=A0A9D4AWT6_9SAUR|nr:hypothetical protein KIL84_017402 [Mauremys mutica]
MQPQQALRWKARFALLYALGGWTLLGCVLYYNWKDHPEQPPPDEERIPPWQTPADAFFTSTITYKQNPSRPITGLYYKVKSFFATSDGPGPEE